MGPEDLVGGRYRLLERIGEGGVAEVWRAHDERLDRLVALKLIRRHASAALREGCAREARRAAAVSHPNVVAVYDARSDGAEAFIAMELVRGRSLEMLLRERGPLPLRSAVAVIDEVAAALDAAHRAGLVHRDVKPANILIDERGRAKLTDFGIAEAADARVADVPLLGTARYLAPEQVAGLAATPRTDVYQLGLVAYELLSGRPCFDGADTVGLIRARVASRPVPLRRARADVPEEVENVIARALATDAQRRFGSAGAFAAALARAAGTVDRTELLPATGVRLPLRAFANLALAALFLVGGIRVAADVRALEAVRLARERAATIADVLSGPVALAAPVAPPPVAFVAHKPTPSPRATPKPTHKAKETPKPKQTFHEHTPNVIGLKHQEAAKRLARAGFASVRVTVDPRAKGKEKTVVRQDPAPGSDIRPGATARLVVVGEKDDD